MAGGMGGFFILADTLTPLLSSVHVVQAAKDDMDDMLVEIVSYAQDNAPWEDRTGDARAGIEGSVDIEGDEVVLSLYHTVDYGKWLELMQNGRFATIMPTLEHYSGSLMRKIGAVETGIDE
jgi:hypothetical protein